MPSKEIYSATFRDRSWDWLQDSEIRALTMTPVFDRSVQLAWFEGLPAKTDYFVWGVSEDDTPIGAFGLKNVTAEEAEYWGYIGERQYWGRSIGRWMIDQSIEEGRKLGLSRIYLKVVDFNERAVRLYQSKGFLETAHIENVVWMSRSL